MILKLKRVAPLQAGKMSAAMYGLISLLIVPFMFAAMAFAGVAAKSGAGQPPLPMMLGMGVGMIIAIPVIYTVMGFLLGVIGAFIYNLLAGWLGGFELEFTQAAPPPVPEAAP
jgi:hypothetical protein